VRVITAADVRDELSPALAVRAVERAFAAHAGGSTRTSQPPLLRLVLDDGVRFQAKMAQVGGYIGLRIAGERDGRHVDEGRRILLYDAERLVPVAILEERDLYRARVGAQLAVTIERLRRPGSDTLTVVGAGRLARATIETVQSVTPFEHVRVHARREVTREGLVDELSGTLPGRIHAVADLDEAVASSDVVVTITTAEHPVVSGASLRRGTLVVSAGGGWECDAEVYARMDRLIVDDWEHCVQVGDLAEMSARGLVTPADVSTTLPRLASQPVDAACGLDEIVVAVPQGMTILDVALAVAVLDGLSERGEPCASS
jgi:ornithine cyclodeaminase/alanine dehydrogenase-like protein (mu-crystallin family)